MAKHMQMLWETPSTDLGSPDYIKYSNYFYAVLSGEGQLQVDLIFDGKKKTFFIDCPARPRVVKKRMKHRGRRFKLRFSNIDGSQVVLKNPILILDILED